MRRVNTTTLLTVFALLLAVTFTGCTKDLLQNDEQIDELNINPEYVSIDWTRTTVAAFDDSLGTYSIQFTDSVPDIHPGSIITIDRDTVVLYRYVTSANVSGNVMTVSTTEAYLTDIFYDSRYTLSTASPSKSPVGGMMFYPEEAYSLDENGRYQALNIKSMGKADTRFTHNLWQSPELNYDGTVLYSGDNYSVTLERMNMSISVDLEMTMNFGGRTVLEASSDAIGHYRSQAVKVEAALVGRFTTEQKVRCDVGGTFRYAPGYDLWKHDLFRPAKIRFVAGGVPIVITLRADLFRQAELSGNGELSAYTGFADNAEGRLGFEWHQSGDINPVVSFSNSFEFIPPTVEGKGQIQAKAWVFPRVSVMLYDAVGPSFDIKPYLADTIRGGFREQMLGQDNDYCAYSVDCHAGMDAACGLSLRFFGYEVENYSTPNVNVIDRRLYHSPKKVEHVSGRPEAGQSGIVRFKVFDYNYLAGQDVATPLPQIVKFEAEGQLSAEYGIANNGVVSVEWTPSDNDILYAKLYDTEGNAIAWDTVKAGECDCDCNIAGGDWVDLGLPSGLLWATRNVGAASPTDYGDYFAWGETSPKSVYTEDTYRYYNSDYVLTKYNGSDGLTILQPGDDAATANYGGRTPTREEWAELMNNTSSQWVTVNGVIGRCFTGTNGRSLFLPAAGDRNGSELYGAGSLGYYWSSSRNESYPGDAWYFYFGSDYQSMGSGSRGHGLSVRAVRSQN